MADLDPFPLQIWIPPSTADLEPHLPTSHCRFEPPLPSAADLDPLTADLDPPPPTADLDP